MSNMYLVPPSIDFIEGEEIDFNYGHNVTLSITETPNVNGRRKRSIINNCPDNCKYQGEWTSLDKNDGTGDHENFP